MISIEQVNQKYGGTQILWDLDLYIPEGKVTCIMGRNGVGKTTLLKCIMGLLPVNDGDIKLEGEAIQSKSAESRAPLGVAYVPQGRDIFPLLTVEENLRVGLKIRKARGIDDGKEVPEKVYELFPVLKDMKHRLGGGLIRWPAATVGDWPRFGDRAKGSDS